MDKIGDKSGKAKNPEKAAYESTNTPAYSPGSDAPPSPPSNHYSCGSKDDTPPWKKGLEIGAVLIALGILIVNLFQNCANQRAASAARDSANVAKDTLLASNRPWIGLSGPITVEHFEFMSEGASPTPFAPPSPIRWKISEMLPRGEFSLQNLCQ
jgi:hypothetical protein